MGANFLWFLAGLAALIIGAELLVRGGAKLAAQLGIPPILVGLTVVSIGTSMPELAVGIRAAAEGAGSLAVGNIAGTNIVNLLLILGLSALIRPLALQLRTLKLDLPMMTIAALLLWLLASNGILSLFEGTVLVACAVLYTVILVRSARLETPAVQEEFASEYAPPRRNGAVWRNEHALRHMVFLVGGIAVVVIGADWLVSGSVGIAREFGISEAVIGLTIVAIGTSAPELVTTLVSTVRNERDIAIGNLLGSSVYNILLILGATALAAGRPLELEPQLVRVDIPLMALVALVCIPVFISGRKVSRLEGGVFVVAYVTYIGYLLSTQLG